MYIYTYTYVYKYIQHYVHMHVCIWQLFLDVLAWWDQKPSSKDRPRNSSKFLQHCFEDPQNDPINFPEISGISVISSLILDYPFDNTQCSPIEIPKIFRNRSLNSQHVSKNETSPIRSPSRFQSCSSILVLSNLLRSP